MVLIFSVNHSPTHNNRLESKHYIIILEPEAKTLQNGMKIPTEWNGDLHVQRQM